MIVCRNFGRGFNSRQLHQNSPSVITRVIR
nr:MAG TPA: hypothetical protein [Caudoviricetes sp.]